MCERITPFVAKTVEGRLIGIIETKCCKIASQIKSVIPPNPSEPAFQVEVCDEHANEIVTYEPLDEDSIYVWCNDCKYYTDPATGKCGC